MKYLAKFYTSNSTSYTLDIFLEEKDLTLEFSSYIKKSLLSHTDVRYEISRNKNIFKIEFFRLEPEAVWTRQ